MGTRMTNQIWIADNTMRACNHWYSIHLIRQKTIINICRKNITYLYNEDTSEMAIFFGADEMDNGIGNIDTMFD